MRIAEHHGPIVVGVTENELETVVQTAAEYARRFDTDLACAFVDEGMYQVGVAADGTVMALSVDPDIPGEFPETFPDEFAARIDAALEGTGIRWASHALAGHAARELGRLAEEADAPMIVVGTRHRGVWATVREFVNGSIAAQLAHRQSRPVVLVPLSPVGKHRDLPWNGPEAERQRPS